LSGRSAVELAKFDQPEGEVEMVSRNGQVSPELRRLMLEQVAAGRTAVDVAREHGIHPSNISRWKSESLPSAATPGQSPVGTDVASTERSTGRYSREFKEEALRQVASGRTAVAVAAQYGVPETTIHRWKKAAKNAGGKLPGPQSTRPKTSGPSPIHDEHRELVLSIKSKHANMGPAQLQNQLKRFHGVKITRQMIGRIFSEAGIALEKRTATNQETDPAKNRFEMTRPNELWAVDFTEFWIHSEKVYALFVIDDYSRFAVGFALTKNPTAELAIETVEKSIQRYGRPERILSDRGSQFHAWNGVSKFDKFLGGFFIDHSVTKARHCFTNGKIEAFIKNLKTELLEVEEFASLDESESGIATHIVHYNFSRTHMGIDGLAPADRYLGMVEEAKRALEEGLKSLGPKLSWLTGLVRECGPGVRVPTVLELVVKEGRLELVVLGRRFALG
jgi:transposase InsO family protein